MWAVSRESFIYCKARDYDGALSECLQWEFLAALPKGQMNGNLVRTFTQSERMIKRKSIWTAAVGISMALSGCSLGEPSWDTRLLAPLAKTRLSIRQLAPEDEIQADSSGLLHLVYRTDLYGLTIDSFFTFSDTTLKKAFRIDSLYLYNASASYPISLGFLARNAGTVGQLIILFNGSRQPIPAIANISGPPVEISADTIFQSMTLEQGILDLKLINGLPIDIENVEYLLKNSARGDIVASGVIPLVPAGGTVQATTDLAGKTVEGRLTAQLVKLSSPGSRGVAVEIDTSDQVIAEVRVYDLHPFTATAVWPAQNLINDKYYFMLEGLDVELKDVFIERGTARFRLSSTLQDSVRFTYQLLTAVKNGEAFGKSIILPPAPPGGVSQRNIEEPLNGYQFMLAGENGDTFNLQYNAVIASIDSTGVIKTLGKNDSMYVEVAFEKLQPNYVRGFLGNDVLGTGPSVQSLDIFQAVSAGNIDVKRASLFLEVENRVGVDLGLRIHRLEGIGTLSKSSIALESPLIQSEIAIPRAVDPGTGAGGVQPGTLKLELNEQNANIATFLSNMPGEIGYDVSLQVNPNGNISQWEDFAYEGDLLNMSLLLDLPMEVSLRGLTMADTSQMNVGGDRYESVSGAVLHAFFSNEFPFDTEVQLYLLSATGEVTDSLLPSAFTIKAAAIGNDGITTGAVESKVDITADRGRIDRIFTADRMILKATMNTQPAGEGVRIFDDYFLEMQLTADFVYTLGEK
ncbi:MAG: hypothetical protein JPMHGGIA_01935 [Saprospiraceae bacterium]|nr:hypothetical protein [Saprospiraceae bacterium]